MSAIKYPQARKSSSESIQDHVLISNHKSLNGCATNVFEEGYSQQFYLDQKKGDKTNKAKPSLKICSTANGFWQDDECMHSLGNSCVRCEMDLSKETVSDCSTSVSPSKKKNGCVGETTDWLNGKSSCSSNESRGLDAEADRKEKVSVKSRRSFFEVKEPRKELSTVGTIIPHAKPMTSLLGCGTDQETPKVVDLQSWSKKAAPVPSGCPFSAKRGLKNVRLNNYMSSTQKNDTLHLKAKAAHCTEGRCMGSLMQPYGGGEENRPYGVPRPKEEVKAQATAFLEEYYASIQRQDTDSHKQRLLSVLKEIDDQGTCHYTYNELLFGAKLAWRNAPRCIGRIQWNNLKLFDARSTRTAREIFEAICEHIDYATNGGNIRPSITVFRERREGHKDVRIWNSQLIRYAGYEQSDGSIIGDPSNVEFTKLCEKLGWKGAGGRFDILPLVIECNDEDPEFFDIPKHLVLEVTIIHPEYKWFEALGLKWYALPAVSSMKFDVGGVEFTCAPFNGWYMVTEIGTRDFGDEARYNMLEPIAERMGLDTKSCFSLWKDRAVTELNQAVLYSYQEAKVTLVDHHTASGQFIKHMEKEYKLRGGCPADWVWIVPPSNGSTTEVFHQEMLNYSLKPSFDYQDDAWRHYQFGDETNRPKMTFKQAGILVKIVKCLTNKIMAKRQKATVLYATETGKSENFAKILANALSKAFDVKIFCMDEYKFSKLDQENLLMIVTSTFGNGEAPRNGEEFGDLLYKLGHQRSSPTMKNGLNGLTNVLEGLRYAVFGLGSSANPNFCAFAHTCRDLLHRLGGKEIHPIGEGDELSRQEESFKKWAKSAFKAACDEFSIDDTKLATTAEDSLDAAKEFFDSSKYKFVYIETDDGFDVVESLSKLHSKDVQTARVISVEELQSKSSSRSTILVRLDKGSNENLDFEPGDHLSVFPSNDPAMVDKIIDRLENAPSPDSPITIKKRTSNGAWEAVPRLPAKCTLRQALTSFINITTPPTQELLRILANLAKNEDDRVKLEYLSKDSKAYEDWKYDNFPTISEVLEDFPSLKLNGIEILTQLPILQARYYSISSSPLMFPDEIHATVALLCYQTRGDPMRTHNGVCSYWMSKLNENDVIPCYVRKEPSFRLPKDKQAPVIMVGPGSGIAPLRSFWQHRKMQREMEENRNVDWGQMNLYTGCRKFKEDNIYQEERQLMLNDGSLDHAYLALSREPGMKKVYVQNMMEKHAKDIYHKIVNQSGHIYVCGNVTMAADIRSIICSILQDELSFTTEQANDFVKELKSIGHYHEDIFGVTKICNRVSIEKHN